MTDEEAIDHALSAVEMRPGSYALLKRNGRVLMALPARSDAAGLTLLLYQPQRFKARLGAVATQILALFALHRMVLPKYRSAGGKAGLDPEFTGCIPGTAGVLLGSPEHRVRRAILCYQTTEGWEVAKLAFGPEGRSVIEGEAAAIRSLPRDLPGRPELRGLHHCGTFFSLLRMPRLRGMPFSPQHSRDAVALLESWILDLPPLNAEAFPEWGAIHRTLESSPSGLNTIEALAAMRLKPAVRHGDFARWNLIRKDDGSLGVLDWEWGHERGMAGLDLVHYFLQDARLVERLSPADAIAKTRSTLGTGPCADYLQRAGWNCDPILPIIASLAWKQGAGHQDNEELLEAAVEAGL
jgi:hypothetical protein